MTLEQIRAALPTHIMLTPGVHRWREGDERFMVYDGAPSGTKFEWREIGHNWFYQSEGPYIVGDCMSNRPNELVARRPIPPHILDNQAFWVFRDQATAVQADEVGGIDKLIKYIADGRLYDKWLLEQMEGI